MAAESTFTFNTGYRLSLTAQSSLRSATDSLSQSIERLSSGLRINNAKDDPAGIALAATTRTDSLVYAQAVRNVNDAISLSNMAYQGLQSLVEVAAKQKELSARAQNSTLSLSQRRALQEESNKLVDEYNRIIQSTDWNDLKPYDASIYNLGIQAGYGANASIGISFGQELNRLIGSGGFSSTGTFGSIISQRDPILADLNEDGILDYISTNFDADGKVFVYIGNGDGTFQPEVSYASGNLTNGVAAADLNGDGHLDIVSANQNEGSISIRFGVGDGTFGEMTKLLNSGTNVSDVTAADIDNDGDMDLISTSYTNTGNVLVRLNNGDGTFTEGISYDAGKNTYRTYFADYNNDGNLDMIAANHLDSGETNTTMLLGNGDGTFGNVITLAYRSSIDVASGDFNLDGNMDLVMSHAYNNTVEIAFGNGDGTFGSSQIIESTEPRSTRTADINGDGLLDVLYGDHNLNALVSYNNGDGTFSAPSTINSGMLSYFAVGDLNNDGVFDLVGASTGGSQSTALLGIANVTTTMSYLNLYTVKDAEASAQIADAAYIRSSNELGRVQAQQNRLSVAVENLQSAQLGYDSAYHRIVDVDVAEEVTNMVKAQIIGDSATAMLAQANQVTSTVMKLLENSLNSSNSK